jgi:3-hydroxybutyryl-CoA dehydrogenase
MQDTPSSVDVVGVVGAGVIGASWSALFLAAGKEVDLFDPAPDAQVQTREYIERAWPALEALEMVRPGASADRLRFVAAAPDAVSRAQFVQESVPERLPLKLETYRVIEPALPPEAVVATSSSGLLLKDMQGGWRDPSRFILGHPFNPPHLIPLVELLGNEHTADGVIDMASDFYDHCGKVTIRVRKEVPAHVANRLQAALWREAVSLVAEGVASVEDVDKAVTAGPGLRWSIMGPHMLFSLASGGLGIEGFCERYRDSFYTWWESLGAPMLDSNTARMLAEGISEEEHGRSFEQLGAERDAKLVAAMRALRGAGT